MTYAVTMLGGAITCTFEIGCSKLTKRQNSYNCGFYRIRLPEGKREDFEAMSGLKLEVPPRVSVDTPLPRKDFWNLPTTYLMRNAFLQAHRNFEYGTCLEFGVYKGGTYLWQVDQIVAMNGMSKLIGFDSWQGLPEESYGVWRPDRHAQGQFKASKREVLDALEQRGLANDLRFRLIDGFFSRSLTSQLQDEIKDLIFVNIDVDLHSSAANVLDFITPLLRRGVIIYFDDWKDPVDKHDGKWGEHLAWEEWLERNPGIKYRTVQVNRLNQRYMEIE
jgi:hypothetical protein